MPLRRPATIVMGAIGQAILLVPSLIVPRIALALVGPERYASVAAILLLIAYASLIDFGASTLAVVAPLEADPPAALALSLVLTVAFPVIGGLAVAAVCSSTGWPLPAGVGLGTWCVVVLAAVFRSVTTVAQLFAHASSRDRHRVVALAGGAVVNVGTFVVLARMGRAPVDAAAYSSAAGGLLSTALLVGELRVAEWSATRTLQMWKSFRRYSGQRVIVQVVGSSATMLDRLAAAVLLPAVGFSAYDLTSRVTIAAKQLAITTVPSLQVMAAKDMREGRGEDALRKYDRSLLRILLVAGPATIAAGWLLMPLWAGSLSPQARPVFAVLVIAAVFHLSTLAGSAFLNVSRHVMPEVGYLCIAVGLMAAGLLVTPARHEPLTIALMSALGLAIGSSLFRWQARRSIRRADRWSTASVSGSPILAQVKTGVEIRQVSPRGHLT